MYSPPNARDVWSGAYHAKTIWGFIRRGRCCSFRTFPERPAGDDTGGFCWRRRCVFEGFICATPVKATRDESAPAPDSAVWIVRCGNASYRMRLDPGQAAKIEPLGLNGQPLIVARRRAGQCAMRGDDEGKNPTTPCLNRRRALPAAVRHIGLSSIVKRPNSGCARLPHGS